MFNIPRPPTLMVQADIKGAKVKAYRRIIFLFRCVALTQPNLCWRLVFYIKSLTSRALNCTGSSRAITDSFVNPAIVQNQGRSQQEALVQGRVMCAQGHHFHIHKTHLTTEFLFADGVVSADHRKDEAAGKAESAI